MVNVCKKIKCVSSKIKKAIDNTDAFKNDPYLTNVVGWTIGFIFKCNEMGKEVFQKDVEQEFNINRSTASELLTTMEGNGFIRREANKNDKRLKTIILTKKAIELEEKVKDTIIKVESKALTNFKQEEIELLMSFLERIYVNLDKKEE